jgi:TonB family protein
MKKGFISLTLALAMLAATTSLSLRAQAKEVYADTVGDFQRFLQDILDASKRGDQEKVASLLKSTEVPDCDAWLHRMYKSDSADSWMGLCDPKMLPGLEKSMADLFAGIAKQNGEISTRKVNDNPEGGEGGLEHGMVYSGKQILEVYFASWKQLDPPQTEGEPIGYFYYLDGGFRWDSRVAFFKTRIGHSKFVPAKLLVKVDPEYPRNTQATGTVRVYYVIGGDGLVYNAHALSGEGLSEDPALRKAAEDAVLKWRFQPATLDGKPGETDGVTVDFKFQPAN